MAMQVAGTMTLGGLIEWARSRGYSVITEGAVQTSGEYGGTYTPRYLVQDDRRVALPTVDEDDLLLDVETVHLIKNRLA